MNNPDTDALAEAFRRHLPDDCRFFLGIVEKGGNVHVISSIQDPGARVEFLERLLERAERQEKEDNDGSS